MAETIHLHSQFPAIRRIAALCCLLLLLAGSLGAQNGDQVFPPKPDPAVYVHDFSGWLSRDQQVALEEKLQRYEDSTSTQIVVMIRPDLGDYDKASYAFELGNRWGIGRKSENNGVVMLIKSQPPDRGIFIATGYGTEGALPDITAGQIIRNTMAPYFKKQQYYEGINAGLDDIIHALSGEFNANSSPEKVEVWVVLLIMLIFVGFMILIVALIYRAAKRGKIMTGKGLTDRRTRNDDWWGGGWGGGGGWSSGGGSSGGSWGGGGGSSFGGGSFGGGGAGGDW